MMVVLGRAGDVPGALLAVDPVDPAEGPDADQVVERPEDGGPSDSARKKLRDDILRGEGPVPAERRGDDRPPGPGAPQSLAIQAIESC